MRIYEHTRSGREDRGRTFTTLVLAGTGLFMFGAGVWCLVSPHSFAGAVGFPNSVHFIHDAGAFQVGIGMSLLLAAVWADAAAVALAAFFVGNTVHTVNHVVDLDVGGNAAQAWGLGLVSLLVLVALLRRYRQLGYVVGEVPGTTSPVLARFARQKTAVLTTYKRDGTAVGTPLSVVVDGRQLYIRSFEKAWKIRRIRNNPEVELAPSTALGKPTGPATRMRARMLQGTEARHAARLLARKYPMLHRLFVPSTHRLLRAKTGRTVHLVLTPVDSSLERRSPAEPALRAG